MANIIRRPERWDPFSEMLAPQLEVKENNDAYVFRADLPGVAEKDLEISVTGNRISVGGRHENEEHQEGDTYLHERSYSRFSHSFTLPDGADVEHIRADLRDGVLALTVPKKPEHKA